MGTPSGLCFLTVLLALGSSVEHGHQGAAETHHVSAGYLFLLRCRHGVAPVTWSREDGGRLPEGSEVRDGSLWFLPLRASHGGNYTCRERNEGVVRRFRLSVSSGTCPETSENVKLTMGLSQGLPCKQTQIFSLNSTKSVRWMKDCRPLRRDRELRVNPNGFLRLTEITEEDSGKYTCLVDVAVDGRRFTAARSVWLTVKNVLPEVFPPLQVIRPVGEEISVQLGGRAELRCLAFAGFSEDSEIYMYWTLNASFVEEYKEFGQNWTFFREGGNVYASSVLTISEVRPHFLDVPIYCHIVSPAESQTGRVLLRRADAFFYAGLSLGISLAFLVLAAASFGFKVELVLACRTLRTHLYKQPVSDGKLYDAYVSRLRADAASSEFALRILPDELENKRGYSLFIGGRDDRPGEAVHDCVSAAVRRCRRLIIVLTTDAEETASLAEETRLRYEQNVGLHDALMKNEPKIILVEIGRSVDYDRLPASLGYVKRRGGALQWKQTQSVFSSNRSFWLNLRQRMPATPTGPRLTT